MQTRKKMLRKFSKSLSDRRDELMAEYMVATHPEYKGEKKKKSMMQKKTEQKKPQYERQGVKYDLYYKKK